MADEEHTPDDSGSTTPPEQEDAATESPDTEGEQQTESEVDYWKQRARENEERSKENHRELEQLRRDAMSEQERAIAEAKDEARAQAFRELSGQVVDAEIRSAANGRPVNVDALLQGLDRQTFIADDGSVDRDSISAWLDQLAPVQSDRRAVDLGQGARGVAQTDPASVFGKLITDRVKG